MESSTQISRDGFAVGGRRSPRQEFREAVFAGLSDSPRQLPCKYFYDHRGSALFDQICGSEAYYLTRSELAITQRYAEEICRQIGEAATLVEYGSGSSEKTRILLDHLKSPTAYVPVDISRRHLLQTADRLRREYPDLAVLPVVADFSDDFAIPRRLADSGPVTVYFPGSTIGNFERSRAASLLRSIATLSGPDGGLLIGIDLVKDPAILELAYNDPEGITAAFNLNLLRRIRDELRAEIDVAQFEHVAIYNPEQKRVEMYVRSRCEQQIVLGDATFDFAAGEMIRTECSHKYTIDGFADLAAEAGLSLKQRWTDEREWFAVLHLVAADRTRIPTHLSAGGRERLADRFRRIRGFSQTLVAPLAPEDCVIQSMPDVSPTRWHLAHTTWFFETFFLKRLSGFRPYDPDFELLFNSYYNSVGEPFPRDRRGLLSRPTLDQVLDYRRDVDDRVLEALGQGTLGDDEAMAIEIGLNHEQQHQELMLTDLKHVLSCNPIFPVYKDTPLPGGPVAEIVRFVDFPGGLRDIGHDGDGFSFDNESPRHQVFLNHFSLADRPVTNGEYQQFIADGGYTEPRWWLSAGWQTVRREGWFAPLYWTQKGDQWWQFTLSGLHPICPDAPVCHVSYFEADAYARWARARLPTEAEWEVASAGVPIEGRFAEPLVGSKQTVHPAPAPAGVGSGSGSGRGADASSGPRSLRQIFGDVWEWTQSPYMAYPGYEPAAGALGEYNGKFMCGQFVLRGGSCATPSGHIRRTYRNFFPPDARWQFSGIRLARD